HAQITLNPYDLFKSFFSSQHPAYLTSLARRSLGEGGLIFTSYFAFSLHQPHRGKCRLINRRSDRQSVVSLVSCNRFPGHRPKDPIDRSIVITGARQLFLNIDGYLVRRQSVVAVDRAVEHKTYRRRVTPGREPVARIPVPPAVVYEDDPVIVASPPTTGVPLPVVIAEDRIPLAAEGVTVPVISNSHVASTIISGVLCPVHPDVPVPNCG